jgi:branched-chain amino acid transport system ATP-binding protein
VALDGVDLSLSAGEVLGVFGPNGAGKTTLFNAISGHAPLDSGSVLFAGQEIGGSPPDVVFRAGVARTFQHAELLESQSVFANVALGAQFCRLRGPSSLWRYELGVLDRCEEALGLFGLAAVRDKPTRLTNLYERNLIMIASAYAASPRLLMLDEPAAGLIDAEIDRLVDLIDRVVDAGITVMVIEHVMRVLMKVSTRVVVLNQGRVLAEGAPSDIQGNPDVRRLYFGERIHA